jgi:hypothetical protein
MNEEQRALAIKYGMTEESGNVASPSVPYVKYMTEDLIPPEAKESIPPGLLAAAYDKELTISNLTPTEIDMLWFGMQRAETMFRMGRPSSFGGYNEELLLSVLPMKLRIKLARSRQGFERQQLTTQTVIRHVGVSEGHAGSTGRRWLFFGKKKVGE